jgi:hypothetical protein
MSVYKDLTGTKFGRWNIVERAENGVHGHVMWKCVCDCGKESNVYAHLLREGGHRMSKSCGCYHKDVLRKMFTTHGYSQHGNIKPEYNSWHSMIERCKNPKFKQYKDYGGRGITVCESWVEFKNFIADMGDKPSDDHSIDRIDNDGNYEPSNCCWSDRKAQSANQRIRTDNTSGTKGVSWDKTYKKYHVRVHANGKKIHIGYFPLLEDAVNARKEAEQKYY